MTLSGLLAGLIFAFVFRDWVRQEIVLPITFVVWVIGLFLRSIDQQVYWTIVVLICVIITLSILWPGPINVVHREPQHPGQAMSRYHQWRAYISNLEHSSFAGDNLARELVRLTVQILSFQQNQSTDETYRQIDTGKISLPEDFAAFLRRRAFVNQAQPRPLWVEFFNQFIPLSRPTRLPGQLSPLEQELESVLEHIENLLAPQNSPSGDEP